MNTTKASAIGTDLSTLLTAIMAAQPVTTTKPEKASRAEKAALVPLEAEKPETARALALLGWELFQRSARIAPTITARRGLADRPIPSKPTVERTSLVALYHIMWGRLDGAVMPSLAAGDTVPLSAIAAAVFLYRERGDFAAIQRVNAKEKDQPYVVGVRTLNAFLIRVANETGRTVVMENETIRLES